MKIVLQLILTIILTYILALFLPYWSVALGAFTIALFVRTAPGLSFLVGFLGIAILWSVYAFITSNANDHILLSRVSPIFMLSDLMLILAISVIGGLLGGFAAATGSQLSSILFPKKPSRNPYRY